MIIEEAYKTIFTNYPDVITVKQLCEMLQIGKTTAYTLLKEGKIKYFKYGNEYKIPKINVLYFMGAQEKGGDNSVA